MKDVKVIFLDVDGTLTNGKIYYDNEGKEVKAFSVKDGMGISQAIKAGYNFVLITGRCSYTVDKRAAELGIKHVYQGVQDKLSLIKEIILNFGISAQQCLYIGDDINDLTAMEYLGFAACPKDAVAEVISICNFISTKKGGEGAVREIIEHVLKEQGIWNSIIKDFKYTEQ